MAGFAFSLSTAADEDLYIGEERNGCLLYTSINFIFEQLMTPALGDTAYGDGQRLVCGAPGAYEGSVEAVSYTHLMSSS